MFGPRTVSRPTNSGLVVALVSLFRLRLAVMFCWSPEEKLPSSASSLLLASQFQTPEPLDARGASTALSVSAWGRFTMLLPRSRRRLVLSSTNTFCSKLLASGASLMECDHVYDPLRVNPFENWCVRLTIIAL